MRLNFVCLRTQKNGLDGKTFLIKYDKVEHKARSPSGPSSQCLSAMRKNENIHAQKRKRLCARNQKITQEGQIADPQKEQKPAQTRPHGMPYHKKIQ